MNKKIIFPMIAAIFMVIATAVIWQILSSEPMMNEGKNLGDINGHILPDGDMAVFHDEYTRILGDRNAPITIYEFSSLTCPHCAAFHANTLPQIKKDYIDTGKAKLVYTDFPLDKRAEVAALLARCVDEDVYFPFLETLFQERVQWGQSEAFIEVISGFGRFAGLSDEDIDACFSNEDIYQAILNKRTVASERFGITSTPSFIIGDDMIAGNQPYSVFKDSLESQ